MHQLMISKNARVINNNTIGNAYSDENLYDISLIHKLCSVCIKTGDTNNKTKHTSGTPITLQYKGIHIGEPDFHDFIREHLLDPIKQSAWEYDYSYMFMDMEYHEQGRHWIFVIVNYINANVKIIGISAHQVFKATYASMNSTTSSQAEKKCLKSMMNNLASIVETIANVG